MKLLVDRLQSRLIDVRIDLRRLDVAVSQKFLHDAKIRAAAEQM